MQSPALSLQQDDKFSVLAKENMINREDALYQLEGECFREGTGLKAMRFLCVRQQIEIFNDCICI